MTFDIGQPHAPNLPLHLQSQGKLHSRPLAWDFGNLFVSSACFSSKFPPWQRQQQLGQQFRLHQCWLQKRGMVRQFETCALIQQFRLRQCWLHERGMVRQSETCTLIQYIVGVVRHDFVHMPSSPEQPPKFLGFELSSWGMDCTEVGVELCRMFQWAAATNVTDYSVSIPAPVAEKNVYVAMAVADFLAKACKKIPAVVGCSVASSAQDSLLA